MGHRSILIEFAFCVRLHPRRATNNVLQAHRSVSVARSERSSVLCRATSAVVFCLKGSLQFKLAMVQSVEGDNSAADGEDRGSCNAYFCC
jgi:hypothetical protein